MWANRSILFLNFILKHVVSNASNRSFKLPSTIWSTNDSRIQGWSDASSGQRTIRSNQIGFQRKWPVVNNTKRQPNMYGRASKAPSPLVTTENQSPLMAAIDLLLLSPRVLTKLMARDWRLVNPYATNWATWNHSSDHFPRFCSVPDWSTHASLRWEAIKIRMDE